MSLHRIEIIISKALGPLQDGSSEHTPFWIEADLRCVLLMCQARCMMDDFLADVEPLFWYSHPLLRRAAWAVQDPWTANVFTNELARAGAK